MKDGIFLRVLCLSGWLTFATRLPRQYHYVAQPMTWTGARSHCRGSFLDIATIGSLEEMNHLIKTVSNAGKSSEVWIGLFDEIKWRWSDGYTGSGADYRKWELSYNEPNFYEAGEFCVTIDNDRGWYDDDCTRQYPFMCYNGSMLDPHFDYVNEYMNWSDAQNYCREHFTDLATVRNDTENLKIQNLLPGNKATWIGLFRDPHFYWSDGSVFSFSYWYTDYNYLGSRTLVCGVADLEKSGRWRLRPCTRKLPFVCYSIPGRIKLSSEQRGGLEARGSAPLFEINRGAVNRQMVKLRMKMDSSVTPSDPAVRADILKKLQDRVEEEGLSGVVLKWGEQPDGNIFHEEEEPPEKRGKEREL